MNPLVGKVLLFTPGDKPERFAKASSAGAGGVIVDLEDAVALRNKSAARDSTIHYLRLPRERPDFLRCLRINGLDTPEGVKDLAALHDTNVWPDVVLLPKVDSPEIALLLARHLDRAPKVSMVALLESARGVEAAFGIAASTPRIAGLALGAADLSAETGSSMSWDALLYSRSRIVHAAAAAGVVAIDVPFLDIKDTEGLAAEARKVAALGMTSKLAIHPAQIGVIRSAFMPDAEALARARGVVQAWTAAGGGAFAYQDRMVDQPVLRAALKALVLAGETDPRQLPQTRGN